MVLYSISFFLVLNSDDWFIMWLGLELNMFSFILLSYKQMSMNHIESCLKYFFVQSLGSMLLLFSFYLNNYMFKYMIIMIMSYKMGAGIFFFWFPSVCSGLGWWSCFFLMTFQKVIPLMICMSFVSWILWLLIFFGLFIGAWGSMNQSQMKFLMAFSSIHHIGWLMMCIVMDMMVWMYYLLMYMLMIFPIIMMMKYKGVYDLMDIKKWNSKFWFMMLLLSMGGMPPLLGFYLKWMLFYYMVYMSFSMFIFMVFMSVLMFYIYIRIVYDFMMGIGMEFGWGIQMQLLTQFLKIDLMSVFGLLLGVFIGLFMML